MSKFSTSSFKKSFSYAVRGLKLAYKSQQNFRTELLLGSFAFILAIFMKFTIVEFCILFMTMAMVLLCELFNSVIEFALDALYHNKYSKLVEMAKDMSAGAVLISTFASIVIGSVLFGGKLFFILGIRV